MPENDEKQEKNHSTINSGLVLFRCMLAAICPKCHKKSPNRGFSIFIVALVQRF